MADNLLSTDNDSDKIYSHSGFSSTITDSFSSPSTYTFGVAWDGSSDCYYSKKPFRNYSVLTKEQFDKLHSLIFQKREVEFHSENLKRPEKYDEAKYNDIKDKDGNVMGKKVAKAQEKIQELKNEGIELEI